MKRKKRGDKELIMTRSAMCQESKRRQIAIQSAKSRKETNIIYTMGISQEEMQCIMKGSIIKNLGQDSLSAVPSWPCSGSPEEFKPSVGHGYASTAKSWPGAMCPWKSLWNCPEPTEHSSNRCHHCSSPAWPKGIYCKMQSREKKGAATQRGPRQPSSAMNAARGAGFLHALDGAQCYLHSNTFVKNRRQKRSHEHT